MNEMILTVILKRIIDVLVNKLPKIIVPACKFAVKWSTIYARFIIIFVLSLLGPFTVLKMIRESQQEWTMTALASSVAAWPVMLGTVVLLGISSYVISRYQHPKGSPGFWPIVHLIAIAGLVAGAVWPITPPVKAAERLPQYEVAERKDGKLNFGFKAYCLTNDGRDQVHDIAKHVVNDLYKMKIHEIIVEGHADGVWVKDFRDPSAQDFD